MKTLALAVAVIAGSAICAQAQQPPIAAFDGKYVGVSITADNQNVYGCKVGTGIKGRPLFIKGGFAQYEGGMTGDWHFQGTMTADGHAMLRDGYGHIINLKIGPDGRVVGMSSSGCNVVTVWQKQG